MTHMIGRVRRRARRSSPAGARGYSNAVSRALRSGTLQAKLKVGPQNDAYEREADAVASRVMEGRSSGPISTLEGGALQRMCAECEEEGAQRVDVQRQGAEEEEETLQTKAERDIVQRQAEEEEEEAMQAKAQPDGLQRQTDEEEEEAVQTKVRPDGSFTAGPGVSNKVARLAGGQPLPSPTRAYFESRFGADFSDVRVHTGPQANAAARDLNARAFTRGRDVVFGRGEYAPGDRKGGELLAHELTHVVQQRGYRKPPGGDGASAVPHTAPVQRWSIGPAPAPATAGLDGRCRTAPAEPRITGQS